MIIVDLKTTDERQGIIHARGTIGGKWLFNRYHTHGMSIVYTVHPVRVAHKWVASFDGIWKPTIPAGCESGNGEQVMALVKERLNEVYGEG